MIHGRHADITARSHPHLPERLWPGDPTQVRNKTQARGPDDPPAQAKRAHEHRVETVSAHDELSFDSPIASNHPPDGSALDQRPLGTALLADFDAGRARQPEQPRIQLHAPDGQCFAAPPVLEQVP